MIFIAEKHNAEQKNIVALNAKKKNKNKNQRNIKFG